MANDLNLGDLKITLETFEDAPVKATFDLPNGSTVARNFPQNGELVMRLGLGLGLNHRVLSAPPALAISGTPVLSATEDEAYAGFTATASGGVEPYAYSLVGDWPAGITINSSNGAVSGTPTESGTFASLSVRVTDNNSDTADLATFTLEVEAAAPAATVEFIAEHEFASVTATTFTVPAAALGDAAADRVIYLAISAARADTPGNSSLVSTVTVGGNSATRVVRSSDTVQFAVCEIWAIALAAGTSGDIVVTMTTSALRRVHVAWAKGYGYSATASATHRQGGGASHSMGYTAGDFILAAAVSTTGSGGTIELAGIDRVANYTVTGTAGIASDVGLEAFPSGSSVGISATHTGGQAITAMIIAVFPPAA